MSAASLYIGIDIGGTSINVGIVDDGGVPLGKQCGPIRLGDGLEAGFEQIEAAVERVVQESGTAWESIAAIGVAAPGTMDIPRIQHHGPSV